jgi:hypothetical protein
MRGGAREPSFLFSARDAATPMRMLTDSRRMPSGPFGGGHHGAGVRAGAGGLDAVFKISLTGLTTTPMATIVRKSELARELGVSRARISQFVAYGLPVRDDGFIDLEQAAQWVLDNIIDQWTDGASPAVRNAQEILWGVAVSHTD